jgi:hypothetical protein
VDVIVRRDDECKIVVKENDGNGWSSDGVVLWLGRRQNIDFQLTPTNAAPTAH